MAPCCWTPCAWRARGSCRLRLMPTAGGHGGRARATTRAARRRPHLGGTWRGRWSPPAQRPLPHRVHRLGRPLLVGADGSAELATDSRYELQAAGGVSGRSRPNHPVRAARPGDRVCSSQVVARPDSRTCPDRSRTGGSCRQGSEWAPLGSAWTDLRMIKDAVELDAAAAACRASDAGARRRPAADAGRASPSARSARWIDDGLRDRSRGPGFDTIVAAGPNGAIPHHQPTDRAARGRVTWSRSTSEPGSTATTPT